MPAWPHQTRAIDAVFAAIADGYRRICLTIPTGGGKTFVATELARRYLAATQLVSLYSNRRLMIDQLSASLLDAGLYHGIRAAGQAEELDAHFQVSSFQTEYSRCVKRSRWDIHDSALVLVDEAHLHTGRTSQAVLNRHLDRGAVIVGLTATPLCVGDCYDTLIIGATPSECRACGALVPAIHYGPDEPDLRQFQAIRRQLEAGDDPSEAEARKAFPQK